MKRLDENLNFFEVLIIYCLRRAIDNVINDILLSYSSILHLLINVSDDVRFNDVIRNLMMNHISFKIFEKNYFSRQIRYDIKAIYLERDSDQLLIQAINRMNRLQNFNCFKRLNDEQRKQMRHNKIIQNLYIAQKRLFQKIHENFDILKEAQDAAAHTKYLHV